MIAPSSPRRSGFTLIELLVVISIIAILLTLLFPAADAAFEMARKTQAKNDVTQIANAVTQYVTEYGKLPTGSTSTSASDVERSSDTDQLMKILSADSSEEASNPRGIVFLEVPKAKVGKNGRINNTGSYLDSWGNPYYISMDADYDNKLTDPTGSGQISKTVLVWSYGNTKKDSNLASHPEKWVKSWE